MHYTLCSILRVVLYCEFSSLKKIEGFFFNAGLLYFKLPNLIWAVFSLLWNEASVE